MRTIAVPLTLINLNDDGFHLLVEIVVFGVKYWAVVDTGASRSVFNKTFIEQNSDSIVISNKEDTNATTLFTTSSTIQTVIPKLKIGKLVIKSYPAVALDLETVNDAYVLMGHPRIVAIIGSDIFHKYQAKINYKKLKILFYPKPD
ncbi:retropepsin-like domain-containing protein [Pedobacter sp. PAMC26386]|nr:retropepsin-like domain-containing protein [Pedobacter sp. PAMC26386]